MVVPSAAANTRTRSVIAFGEPSRCVGRPTTTAAIGSSSSASRARAAATSGTDLASSACTVSTVTGRARTPLASLMATPTRRSPTSSPTIRPTPYNSRTAAPINIRQLMNQVLRFTCLVGMLTVSGLSAQIPVVDTDSRRVDERIRALQKEADRLAGSSRTLLNELRALEVERNLRAAEGDKADAAVAESQILLRQTDARLTKLEQERIEQLPAIAAQLVDLYKHGNLGYARVLFGARDVRELGRASRTFAAL